MSLLPLVAPVAEPRPEEINLRSLYLLISDVAQSC